MRKEREERLCSSPRDKSSFHREEMRGERERERERERGRGRELEREESAEERKRKREIIFLINFIFILFSLIDFSFKNHFSMI